MKPDSAEYDFGRVPDGELFPRCCWEYARESRTVLKPWVERRMQRPKGNLPIEAAVINYSFYLVRLLGATHADGISIPPVSLAPWQKLEPAVRQQAMACSPRLIKSRKSYKEGSPTFAPQDPGSAFRRVRPGESPDPGIYCGKETGAFVIDWNFRNDEIVAAMPAWLKANRPKNISHHDGRGHSLNHYRVALKRLGIMRRIYADPSQADAEQNKEVRRALTHFREFVIVEDGEKPIHWPEFLGTE